ncbi:hypothetical protein [Flavobacterium sp. I3-2]|uniref:hypothetical protein n=1 Tax=Flavobacterium sp. I3-2 TaxID=2748319 RepID=UPI0015AF7562|nr:hypothetical protein [Flavobacterium sp. I3-2]
MKNVILLFCFIFNFGYAQKQITESNDVISTPVLSKSRPLEYDISDWSDSMKNDMKKKWNLNFSKVLLRFIIEENGTISTLNVSSKEWIPTEHDISELLNMINSKGKWIPSTVNNQISKTRYSILLTF